MWRSPRLLNNHLGNLGIPCPQSAYAGLRPANVQPLRPSDFNIRVLDAASLNQLADLKALPAKASGKSCNEVCAEQVRGAQYPLIPTHTQANSCALSYTQALRCAKQLMSAVNNCDALRRAFACDHCEENYGFEQPAFVTSTAPPESVRQCRILPQSGAACDLSKRACSSRM